MLIIINYIISFTIGAIAKSNYYYEYQLTHAMYNVTCTGNENTLLNCSYHTTELPHCHLTNDAGVICQGKLTM